MQEREVKISEIDPLAIYLEINVNDGAKIGPGFRVVKYLGFRKGRLLCEDWFSSVHKLTPRQFVFLKVSGYDTKVTDQGEVKIRSNNTWINLGKLFSENRYEDKKVVLDDLV